MTDAPTPVVSTLANGLRVVTTWLEWARRAAITLNVRVGARDESAKHKGIAHFAEHLCFRGTVEYPSESELNAQFQAIGAAVNAFTDYDSTQFQIGVLPEHLPRALHLLAGMMHRNPLNGFAVERRVVLNEMRHYEGRDALESDSDWVAPLWSDLSEQGQTVGSSKTVEDLKLEDLRAHYSRFYVGKNMVLSVASPLPDEHMLAAAAPFSALSAGLPHLRGPTPALKPSAIHHRLMDEHHCQLRLVFPFVGSIHPIEAQMRVLDQVLHGNGHGALFRALRSTRGLVYTCHSNLLYYADFANLVVSLDPNPADPVTPLSVVTALLSNLRRQPITPAELHAAKQGVRMSLAGYGEDPWAISALGANNTMYEWPIDLAALERGVLAVTSEEIRVLAERIFKAGVGHLNFTGPAKHEKALWKTFKSL